MSWDTTRKRRLAELVVQELSKEDLLHNLDGPVHDCASEIATDVNNHGYEAQVAYLIDQGWTPEDILGRAKFDRDGDGECDCQNPEGGLVSIGCPIHGEG